MPVEILPISEKAKWEALPDLIDRALDHLSERGAPPIIFFAPIEDPKFPHIPPTIPEPLDRVIVVSLDAGITEAIFKALRAVEMKEPGHPGAGSAKMNLKANTPIKAIYRQMTEMPATVFSFTFPDELVSMSVFFLRSEFTINEFRKEMESAIL